MSVSIAPLCEDEIETLSALAHEIWRVHYPSIIGPEQTEYMLRQRYAPEIIRGELQSGNVWWDTLKLDGVMLGFSSTFPADRARALKLDKLYVHSNYQRRGFGGMLIEHARERARELGFDTIVLAVNRQNSSAIAAYRKHGFETAESIVKEIGGGFVMDDYVMAASVQ